MLFQQRAQPTDSSFPVVCLCFPVVCMSVHSPFPDIKTAEDPQVPQAAVTLFSPTWFITIHSLQRESAGSFFRGWRGSSISKVLALWTNFLKPEFAPQHPYKKLGAVMCTWDCSTWEPETGEPWDSQVSQPSLIVKSRPMRLWLKEGDGPPEGDTTDSDLSIYMCHTLENRRWRAEEKVCSVVMSTCCTAWDQSLDCGLVISPPLKPLASGSAGDAAFKEQDWKWWRRPKTFLASAMHVHTCAYRPHKHNLKM